MSELPHRPASEDGTAKSRRTVREHLSPKQVAQALGVSEASVKRWCDADRIATSRTAGGHRRIPLHAVLQFIRSSGAPLVRPEILGLPPTTGKGERGLRKSIPQIEKALEEGDTEQVRRVAFNLYLAGQSCADICDVCFAPVFRTVGCHWEDGSLEVYRERRACEITLRVVHELYRALPPAPAEAPLAVGGAMEHDPYSLPTTMVELVLGECGWRAESLGVGLPAATLRAAISERHPRLFWLSVSTIGDPQAFLSEYASIYESATASGTAVVVGGRALVEDIRQKMRYSTYCDRLAHLVSFVDALR